ncbi:hypothetical protein EVAR_31095_1 [Eumeta japonica]|uniref:Uncharacterized protein n=1 Tax=Eumeta variegata TaxID=151549 RepID=A0A4C2AD42_EUMVA|nr:hypothetical protein EVAR_31095_1 [Eumeta japonica]
MKDNFKPSALPQSRSATYYWLLMGKRVIMASLGLRGTATVSRRRRRRRRPAEPATAPWPRAPSEKWPSTGHPAPRLEGHGLGDTLIETVYGQPSFIRHLSSWPLGYDMLARGGQTADAGDLAAHHEVHHGTTHAEGSTSAESGWHPHDYGSGPITTWALGPVRATRIQGAHRSEYAEGQDTDLPRGAGRPHGRGGDAPVYTSRVSVPVTLCPGDPPRIPHEVSHAPPTPPCVVRPRTVKLNRKPADSIADPVMTSSAGLFSGFRPHTTRAGVRMHFYLLLLICQFHAAADGRSLRSAENRIVINIRIEYRNRSVKEFILPAPTEPGRKAIELQKEQWKTNPVSALADDRNPLKPEDTIRRHLKSLDKAYKCSRMLWHKLNEIQAKSRVEENKVFLEERLKIKHTALLVMSDHKMASARRLNVLYFLSVRERPTRIYEVLSQQYPGLVNRKRVLLQQDYDRPRTAKITLDEIEELSGIELLPHAEKNEVLMDRKNIS